jgi:hypothetical protein
MRTLATLLVAVGYSTVSQAQTPAPLDPSRLPVYETELMEPPPEDAPCTVQPSAQGCIASLHNGRITLAGCERPLNVPGVDQDISSMRRAAHDGVTVACGSALYRVGLPQIGPAEVTISSGDGDALRVDGAAMPSGALLVVRTQSGWLNLTRAVDLQQARGARGLYRAGTSGAWRYAALPPPPQEARVGAAAGRPPRNEGQEVACDTAPLAWCRNELRGASQGACFAQRAGENDLQLILLEPGDHILAPNEAFVIVVRHLSSHAVEASLSGMIGLTEPTFDDQRGAERNSTAESVTCAATRASFGPRTVGEPLELAVDLKSNGATVDTEHLELIVEQTYWGALRFGVGIPFGVVDREYTAERIGGSAQSEIVAGGGFFDVEIVATFAAFLFEAFDGGRSYRHGTNWTHWGLFASAGIVAASETGARFLTSFYFGAEWEPARSFSIGLGVVLRRVGRLRDGYRVGDAVVDGARLDEEHWEPGFGVVIGVTPEFLEFAGAIGGGE